MALITDPPPAEVAADLAALKRDLDLTLPPKVLDRSLLIATWNIRAFGGLTDKWAAGSSDSPKRDLHAALCIAEIISRFDVVALQEVTSKLKALRHVLKVLGDNWGLILTDVTRGDPGNRERLAFLFDKRKVQLSGLACELVVPYEWLSAIDADALIRQFARTPYAVSFKWGRKTFILVTLHVLYGDSRGDRVPELTAIAQWLADWAANINAWDHNLILLGDFNIDRVGDQLYDAFTSTGLHVPDKLNTVPRTLFSDPLKPEKWKFYDQIAWFNGAGNLPRLSMECTDAGYYNFTETTMQSRGLTKSQLSWRISDHFPLWAKFAV